ncbi:hypothetical protein J6590_034105 [Homalodisca vitripennis]|nr:hypothetical protein J6590_034105 [Homalodisca vitripennis]
MSSLCVTVVCSTKEKTAVPRQILEVRHTNIPVAANRTRRPYPPIPTGDLVPLVIRILSSSRKYEARVSHGYRPLVVIYLLASSLTRDPFGREVRANKPSLTLDLASNGLKVTSEPPPMAGQVSCLQGEDRSPFTHPAAVTLDDLIFRRTSREPSEQYRLPPILLETSESHYKPRGVVKLNHLCSNNLFNVEFRDLLSKYQKKGSFFTPDILKRDWSARISPEIPPYHPPLPMVVNCLDDQHSRFLRFAMAYLNTGLNFPSIGAPLTTDSVIYEIRRQTETLDFGSELEIAQVQILSVTLALVISTLSTLPLILFDKILAQASGPLVRAK